MTPFRTHTDLARVVAVVATGTFFCACTTWAWETQTLQPERFRTADRTQSVRLILRSGDTLVVRSPVITGDTLVGLRSRSEADPDSLDRFSVPLAVVSEAQLKEEDRASTAVVGILALVGVLAAERQIVTAMGEARRPVGWGRGGSKARKLEYVLGHLPASPFPNPE